MWLVMTIMVDINGKWITGRKSMYMELDQGYTGSFRNYSRSCTLSNNMKEGVK